MLLECQKMSDQHLIVNALQKRDLPFLCHFGFGWDLRSRSGS